MLINLIGNEKEIKRQNKYLRNQRRKYGKKDEFWANIKEISSIDDFCLPYDKFISSFTDEEKDKYFKVKDFCSAIKGVYIVELNSEGYLERLVTPKMKEEKERHLYFHGYGVCDNASQVLLEYNKLLCEGLISKNNNHIITLTPIFKNEHTGWRWHKWGKYIGVQERKHEYLIDEEDIEMVFVYNIQEMED